jgi:hypothetical protein
MKHFAFINAEGCQCLWTFYAVCKEFMNGFVDFGYSVSEAKTLEDCKNKDILLLSNQNINTEFLIKLNKINPNATYILWFYHSLIDKIPFKKYILTSEYFYKTPRTETHRIVHEINKSIPNFVPLMLRSNEDPLKIGTFEKTYELNGCFMGCAYKRDWIEGLDNILYHDIANGLLSYEERKKIYLKSKIAFGFSSDDNILNYHPSQRIFEGLTYGCVVISDNEAARDLTGGIVVYAVSKEDFLAKYYFYLTHPNECKKKEQQALEWAKKYGTNRYAASLFIDKIKELNYS